MKSTRRAPRIAGARKTRRSGGLTVEGLQASFEKIDRRMRCMIEKGKTDTQLGCCLKKAWRDMLHSDLSAPAARGLISHYRATHKPSGKQTRKVQRGGMAPLDWTMGQGSTVPVYGRFPVETGAQPSVVASLDRFYENPIGRSCDSTGGYPAPAQVGGGLLDTIFNGAPPMSVPVNVVQSTVSAVQGKPMFNPPASPISAVAPTSTYVPKPFEPTALSQITSLAPLYQPAA